MGDYTFALMLWIRTVIREKLHLSEKVFNDTVHIGDVLTNPEKGDEEQIFEMSVDGDVYEISVRPKGLSVINEAQRISNGHNEETQ